MADFTPSQARAFERLTSGANCFVTGQAGHGKSWLIERFIEWLRHNKRSYVAVAPTGIAALNLPDGVTIHRAFDIRPRPVYSMAYTPQVPPQLEEVQTIIIDEVSMVRCDLFDALARMMMELPSEPQVVVVGDFFQLPPVITDRDASDFRFEYPKAKSGFAFEGNMWDGFNFECLELAECVRQSEGEFIDNLDRARLGNASCIPYFNERVGKSPAEDAIRLYGTNRKADSYNKMRVHRLKQPIVKFTGRSVGDVKDSDKAAPQDLELAVGARVMAVANEPLGFYVNGSFGTVTDIVGSTSDPSVTVLFDGDEHPIRIVPHTWRINALRHDADDDDAEMVESVGEYTQIPLKLGYAITMHKSQGQTYDACHIEPNAFADGQLYVALSRCRKLDGLTLASPIRGRNLMASDSVNDFYGRMRGTA